MGDSSLTLYLGVGAWTVILVALVMAALAWWIPRRAVRVGIGVGLVVLALPGGVILSFAASVLVAGLGAAVIILGVRTLPADSGTEPTGR